MPNELLIRADGSHEIGTGHIMRCLTIAQAWVNSGGVVRLAVSELPEGLSNRADRWCKQIRRLDTEPGSNTDADKTIAYAKQYDTDWIIVDGPHFHTTYQRIIADAGIKMLTIDDMGELEYYHSDMILNQNIHANKNMYSNSKPETKLLLGSRYILLRREFLEWREWSRDIPETPNKILVTLGGSDPINGTKKIIKALDQVENKVTARVILGAENTHYREITEQVKSVSKKIDVKCNISNMAEQMVWADLAVSSGGTTCWELAFMGLPTVVGIVAPIEEHLVEGLKKEELFYHLGYFEKRKPSQIAGCIDNLLSNTKNLDKMSNKAQKYIDGYGQERVIKNMKLYNA